MSIEKAQQVEMNNLTKFARKKEYENYFNELGMKNILIYAEKLIDLSPDSHCLEEVIAVFATPPNSYSAVTDPIDLVCRYLDFFLLLLISFVPKIRCAAEVAIYPCWRS